MLLLGIFFFVRYYHIFIDCVSNAYKENTLKINLTNLYTFINNVYILRLLK
jgi:hypothetical protein